MPAPAEVVGATRVETGVNNPADLLWNLIIRPPRSQYRLEQLGPTNFRIDKRVYGQRTDIELKNPRGHTLKCSFFEPMQEARKPVQERLPCVVFLHGNSSCRLEAVPLVSLLLPLWITVFCFDFSGCGISEGEYISLGWHERDDLATCIEYLRSTERVSTIALWGRSMGAFTALLHADRDPTIAGLVLDSPFTSLASLAEELAQSYAKVPAWMVHAVLAVVRSVIQSKAGFDIEDLQAVDHVSRSFSPALFIAATGDDFILPHHAQKLHEAYQGEKEFHLIPGDHNSARPEACRRKAALFLCRTFHDKRVDKLISMHTSGLFDIFTTLSVAEQVAPGAGGGSSTDEDADAICRQMQIFPALRMMMLTREQRCRRPLLARTTIKLLQETSEAGFFLRVEPCCPEGGLQGQGLPRMLVMTVSVNATIISRICDDALDTVAVGQGAPASEAKALSLNISRSGGLQLQLGDAPPLQVDIGFAIREEVTLWLMLLRGQTTFGTLHVEDSEATLRENLGEVCLRGRHLGLGHSADAPPLAVPRGDSGLARGPPAAPVLVLGPAHALGVGGAQPGPPGQPGPGAQGVH